MQLLGLISACVLMRSRRRENFIYRDLADTEGMHIWCDTLGGEI